MFVGDICNNNLTQYLKLENWKPGFSYTTLPQLPQAELMRVIVYNHCIQQYTMTFIITVRTLKLVLLGVKFDLYASIYLSGLICCLIQFRQLI